MAKTNRVHTAISFQCQSSVAICSHSSFAQWFELGRKKMGGQPHNGGTYGIRILYSYSRRAIMGGVDEMSTTFFIMHRFISAHQSTGLKTVPNNFALRFFSTRI